MLDAGAANAVTSAHQASSSAADPSCTPSGSRWAVVATYANAEFRAERHLREQHYETYLPTILAKRRHRFLSGRTTWSLLPLFPCYAFVALEPDQPWRAINHTLGVYRLLLNANGCPEICRAGAVEALQAAEALRRCLPAETPAPAPGTPVAVSRGMVRHRGIVLRVMKQRAAVLLMMFGALREVVVGLCDLVPVEDQSLDG